MHHMIITCVSCDPCRCGGCVQQVTCQWCSRDLECKPRGANSCSDGNVVYTVSGLKGVGLRRRGWRGGAEEEGWRRGSCCTVHCTQLPVTSRQKGRCQQCFLTVIIPPPLPLIHLPVIRISNLSWCMLWLQDATQDRCPQIVPTPGPNVYSFPVHLNMTSHIDVHVTFGDNTIPVSHTSLSTNCS